MLRHDRLFCCRHLLSTYRLPHLLSAHRFTAAAQSRQLAWLDPDWVRVYGWATVLSPRKSCLPHVVRIARDQHQICSVEQVHSTPCDRCHTSNMHSCGVAIWAMQRPMPLKLTECSLVHTALARHDVIRRRHLPHMSKLMQVHRPAVHAILALTSLLGRPTPQQLLLCMHAVHAGRLVLD